MEGPTHDEVKRQRRSGLAGIMSDHIDSVRIKKARVWDLVMLQRLSKRCFGRDAWSWVDMLAALVTPGAVRLKALRDGRLIGYVIADQRDRGVGWIASIAVAPGARRKGIGSLLLKAAEGELNTTRIRLALRPSNRAALNLYQRHGYETVIHWPRYYNDGEDALVMEKPSHGDL